jgi:2-keto-3-deoxy-L-rhamnonate aldolase RhmA
VKPAALLTGTVLTLPGAGPAELLAEPFDLVWIDLEHGALGRHEAQEMLIGAQAAGTRAFVRLPARAHGLMAAMLDAGADGVVLAAVEDAGTAERAGALLRHPPDGRRGYGPRRVAARGRTRAGARTAPGGPAQVGAAAPALWAQIESAAGVERAAEIAAVPGIGALVVGTADLSFALGAPLDLDAPALRSAVARVRATCAAAGVAFGLAGALEAAPPALLAGAAVLVHGTDVRLCAAAVDAAAGWLRGTREAA